MKFKLSKMSRKKQIAIACAVASGASVAALIILGAKARMQAAMPVGTRVQDWPMGDIRQPLMEEERHKREKNFKFIDKVHHSVD